ncbi:sensor histidine kinase [Paenibacillus sp. strain BS8-2]
MEKKEADIKERYLRLFMNRSIFIRMFLSMGIVSVMGILIVVTLSQQLFQSILVDIETKAIQRGVDQTGVNLDNRLIELKNDMFHFLAYSDNGPRLLEATLDPFNITPDMAYAAKVLGAFRQRYPGDIESVFFYRDDDHFFHDYSLTIDRNIDYSSQAWYRHFTEGSSELWTEPTTETLFYQDKKQPTILAGMSLKNVGTRDGIFVVRLSAKLFRDAFVHLESEDVQIQLLNKEGQLIYTSATMQSTPAAASQADYIVMSSRLEQSEFEIRMTMNRASIIDKVHQMKTINIFVIVTVVIFTLLFSSALALSLVKPIKKLLRLMRRVEKGDFDVRFPVRFSDEVGLLGHGFNQMVIRVSELIHEVYVIKMEHMESQLQQKEATLKALQNQINPHFLYNTLEVINCHAIVHDIPSISQMSKALSDFFRYSIENHQIEVSLFQELQHVKTYLKIQQERYPDIEIDIRVQEELLSYSILKLVLQPILENCYAHGFRGDREYGIQISSGYSLTSYQIIVEDNGEGMEDDALQKLNAYLHQNTEMPIEPYSNSSGIGISNVHARLRMHYGEPYGLTYAHSASGGIRVVITLPPKEMRT